MLLTWSKRETWDNVADEMFTFELKVRHQPSGKEMYLQLGDLPNVGGSGAVALVVSDDFHLDKIHVHRVFTDKKHEN